MSDLSKEAKEILQDLNDLASDMMFKAYDKMSVESRMRAGKIITETEKEIRGVTDETDNVKSSS
jgi:hypothetical protein